MATRIERFEYDVKKLLDECITSMSEHSPDTKARKERIGTYSEYILKKQKEYISFVSEKKMEEFIDDNVADEDFKKDMIWLYDNKFSKNKSVGRKLYNSIKMSAPSNRCPYCLHRDVSQVDHFMPKASKPVLSIVGENLVPSCSECNHDKLNEDKKFFSHPYFDDIDNDIFLVCQLVKETDICFDFKIIKPSEWTNDLFERVENQILSSDLLNFYAQHSVVEFNLKRRTLKRLSNLPDDLNELKSFLNDSLLDAETVIGVNSWQAALYRCLLQNCNYINNYL
ncbi:HNH endonuclease [Enterococcus faecium]|nr:HNH endonuclease [Enterococcus faecium]